MDLNFKKWLVEMGTDTACVANFARPVGSNLVKRSFPDNVLKKKKKDSK